MEEERSSFTEFLKPYMRLYEQEEECIQDYRRGLLEKDDNLYILELPTKSDPDAYRTYHVLRFFNTMKGFYTGQLDLTGRHMERFNELSKKFSSFRDEFDTIRATVEEEEYEDEDWNGETRTLARYIMTDEERWKGFRLKWKLPRVMNFGVLKMWMGMVSDEMTKAGMVFKVQKLRITDLPPELVHHIFSFTSLSQARLLASTCKLMKEIGVSYLYHTRTMKLNFVSSERLSGTEWEEQDLEDIAQEKSEQLLRQLNFLETRPDLTDAIQHLNITDGWKQDVHLYKLSFFHPYTHDQRFYGPINISLNGLLSSCHILTHLSISYCAITGDWLRTISCLEKLHTIRLFMAYIKDEAVEADIIHDRIPLSPQVLNVYWTETENTPSHGLWYTLILFPNLLTFGRKTIKVEGWLPVTDIQRRCLHFCAGVFTSVTLKTDLPHSDTTAISLLEALQSAPLEVLVLEGVKDGSLTLFERIANLFPDLIGLTIIRRENTLQRRTNLSRWPHQCGEYALTMRGFRRLKYFGWNFYVPPDDTTPAALLRFEERAMREAEGTPEPEEDEHSMEFYRRRRDESEAAYFQDSGSIALPFAAHCSMLEVMGLEARWRSEFAISRDLNGGIAVVGNVLSSVRNTRIWNPTMLDRGWEPIVLGRQVTESTVDQS
ncbi:hypothetical protein AAF712_006632 [Marasmius tenuissimus]|uniref:F-box domain-containing protein n=1 Tax=Marasmius tenuissimus TaxID=585030 RepID=A0ABR2ZYE0_9AGAR